MNEDEDGFGPPICDECYRVIMPEDGPVCPICQTPYDRTRDDDDWRDEAFDEEFSRQAIPHPPSKTGEE